MKIKIIIGIDPKAYNFLTLYLWHKAKSFCMFSVIRYIIVALSELSFPRRFEEKVEKEGGGDEEAHRETEYDAKYAHTQWEAK